ncbi:hypothetical protein AB3S75_000702 [Citrus x aurantiifolia]
MGASTCSKPTTRHTKDFFASPALSLSLAGVFRDTDAAAATNNEVEEGDEGNGGAGEGPSRSDDDFDGGGDNDQQIREMEAYFLG